MSARSSVTSSMTYDNDQQAATLWYHDHALGITRLNVYAGLAGFYVLQDQNRLDLVTEASCQAATTTSAWRSRTAHLRRTVNSITPLTRTTLSQAQRTPSKMWFPKKFYKENGNDAPSIVPEFFGDTIVVNGMAWPKLDVAEGDYEFRLLNGSDSRFYVLEVSDPNVAVYLVGTDGGLLHQAITISDGDGIQESNEFLVLAPGDRVELVFDFSKLDDGDTVTLLNVGPAFEPFKGLAGADGSSLVDANCGRGRRSCRQHHAVRWSIRRSRPFDAKLVDKQGDGTDLVKDFVNLARTPNTMMLPILRATFGSSGCLKA